MSMYLVRNSALTFWHKRHGIHSWTDRPSILNCLLIFYAELHNIQNFDINIRIWHCLEASTKLSVVDLRTTSHVKKLKMSMDSIKSASANNQILPRNTNIIRSGANTETPTCGSQFSTLTWDSEELLIAIICILSLVFTNLKGEIQQKVLHYLIKSFRSL